MATPAKSVQFREVDSLVESYTATGIPSWAIFQNNECPNWRYIGESVEDGARELQHALEYVKDSESAAIYTLALFEQPERRLIAKNADLSWNFRLRDQVTGFAHEQYGGSYGQLLLEMKELKKEIAEMKQTAEPENKLGLIGEIMEHEAFAPFLQPMLAAIGNKMADSIMGKPTGQVARIAGISSTEKQPAKGMDHPWREDPVLCAALDGLSARVPDLPELLEKLYYLSVEKPTLFNLYKNIFKKMG